MWPVADKLLIALVRAAAVGGCRRAAEARGRTGRAFRLPGLVCLGPRRVWQHWCRTRTHAGHRAAASGFQDLGRRHAAANHCPRAAARPAHRGAAVRGPVCGVCARPHPHHALAADVCTPTDGAIPASPTVYVYAQKYNLEPVCASMHCNSRCALLMRADRACLPWLCCSAWWAAAV